MPASQDHRVREIVADHAALEGPLLPILQAVQAEFGHVPPQALPVIAEALNIGRAEVHGVASFYHDLRTEPAGRHVVKLCRAEACQAQGAVALAEAVKARLGLDWHQTSADGAVTLEPVFCLGLCACGPSAMVDDKLIGRAEPAAIEALVGARP
jgi:formate dehydrogenase subunit gamma